MWKKVLILGAAGAAVLTAGILLGHFAIGRGSARAAPAWVGEVARDLDEAAIAGFLAELDRGRIQDNLRELSRYPHMATSTGDQRLVKLILDRWRDPETGLDRAWTQTYNVFLSFPNKSAPNRVHVLSPQGAVLFESQVKEKPYFADQNDTDVVPPFAAFAPAGTPKGRLVYANQGKLSDYEQLNRTLDLTGTIAITRYGGTSRADKALHGARFGVAGVLVYTDPLDINDGATPESETYPHSWYLPPSGVERGSYKNSFGDLLTPYYPSKEHTYRRPESEVEWMAPVPTQPIGFEDAQHLICALGGDVAPGDWQGGLGCTYRLGPGFSPTSSYNNSDVQVTVRNRRGIFDSDNVMGLIRGSVEPDRYVIYGNHRDSWVHGAIDPSSGTAVMLELTRVLGGLVRQGKWRPRRSILFGSWGAEEFGLIGSTEFTEENYSALRDRAVAYINVDISVYANATLQVSGSPAAQGVVFAAAKQVQAPGPGSLSVYENWKRFANRTSPAHGVIPSMGYLTGAGSDYASFMHFLGITSMDVSYTYDKTKTRARIYPAYHTAYDTFDYASRFVDPGFTSHQAVARTAGGVLLRLADSLVLPFGPGDYAESLESYLSAAEEAFAGVLRERNISLAGLQGAVRRFRTAATQLDKQIAEKDFANTSPLRIRGLNDQLMLLERAFLDPLAFPDKYYLWHVIWASRTSPVATFPGLADAVARAAASPQDSAWRLAHKQLTIVTTAIERAAIALETV
ncbi:aminopeptidase NAALADL1-like [Lepisosteus oculatus]|uniref:aminopeptidase NAALADL1-like n=1 Tax=Lepisosteus oculatus TaxID=7918 RepID=UPI0035F52534